MLQSMPQTCSAWTLRAWPPLLWQVDQRRPLHLRHLGTQLSPGDGAPQARAGQTLWAGLSGGAEAGMAWDWVQLDEGVLALADPMAVVTNLRLLGPQGEYLGVYESARHLNQILHALPWQDEVERALAASLAQAH